MTNLGMRIIADNLIHCTVAMRMWFIKRNRTSSCHFLPSPSTVQNPDFLPTKNWAAVDPLSTAGQPGPYMVSVATASFLLGMLSAGFGALCRFHSFNPFTAPSQPS